MIKLKSQLNQIVSFSTVILLITFFASCEKEPDGLGLGVLPGQDNLTIKLDSSASILATTVKFESMPSYDTTSVGYPDYILGEYANPVFGLTKASLIVNFHPDTIKYSFGDGKKADSLVFQLKLDSLFGDPSSNIEFKIWELKKGISLYSSYNTNLPEEEYKGTLVATQIMKYNDTLKIKLDKDLADRIIQIPSPASKDTAGLFSFQDKFKGLYIEARSTAPGLYLSLDPWKNSQGNVTRHETKLTLHYQNTANDSLKQFYYVNTRVSKFTHDYTGTPVASALQNNDLDQKITFVQGLAGLGTRISIPDISKWKDLSPVSISKAELVIPVSPMASVGDTIYPKGLFIKTVKTGVNNFDFIEYGFGQSFLNGKYNSEKKAYIFNLAKHIQKIANSKFSLTQVENTDLMILADSYRVGLTNSFSNVALNFAGAKLYVIYSKQ
jgi:hypothetical protein